MRGCQLSLTLLILLLLTGCSDPDAEDLVKTYTARTSNAIEIDFSLDLQPAASLYPPLPPRRERLAEIEEIREGLLDLLDLRHCNLVGLVAERNSSLGRVATPSQRLIYELKLLPALTNCIKELEGKDDLTDLRARLVDFQSIKAKSFPAQLFNSIYNSSEMEQQFSLGEPALSPDPERLDTGAIKAVSDLSNLSTLINQPNWQTPDGAENLEAQYELLYRSRFGGQWLSSMALLTQTLNQTAKAIEERLAGRPICFNRQPNNQSKILWNVFNRYYVQELQPYLAQVDRNGRSWQAAHQKLLTALKPDVAEVSSVLSFFSEEGPVWQPYLAARDRHTQAWQEILEQCGLRPGNNPRN